jgi:hypothetical protein
MMIAMFLKRLLAVFLLATLSCSAQQSSPDTKPLAKTTAPVAAATTAPALDLQALVKETEVVDLQRHKIGVFWWISPEFWQAVGQQQGLDKEQVAKIFQPFGSYNVFMIAVGTLDVGHAVWADQSTVKKNVVLRDQRGNAYKPLQEAPDDIRSLVELMRPTFKNMMGTFGEGMQFVVFPLKDGEGNIFADAHKSSEMYLDVFDLMGTPTNSYTWRFPLTSLSPQKYCPVGKERVEASWKYCPWHGNKLEGPTVAGTPASAKQ